MNPKVIIYDFDGVICDSVSVKTEAFAELYSQYGKDIQDQVRAYHLEHGGISRFEKFKYFHTILLKKEVSQSDIEILGGQFASLIKEKVIESPYINGVYDFIKKNNSKMQFICTGTPEEEILEIAKRKGISGFFKKIYGSPKIKTEIIQIILRETYVNNKECVFFGDAMTDYYAAQVCEIPFIGIENSETKFPDGTTVVRDFKDSILNFF